MFDTFSKCVTFSTALSAHLRSAFDIIELTDKIEMR